jgi:hypothetical protein
MMYHVRTALTLDPDVADQLARLVKETGRPFKQLVNESLRRGMKESGNAPSPFNYQSHDGELLPGIDPRGLNDLAWE